MVRVPSARAPACLLILVLLVLAVLAGCQAPEESHSAPATAGSPPAAMPVATPARASPPAMSSPSPAVSLPVPPATLPSPAPVAGLTFGEWTRVEYRMNNTVTMPPNPRFQWISTVRLGREAAPYAGTPAILYTGTLTADYPAWVDGKLVTAKDGLVEVTRRFYAAGDNRFLGGTMTRSVRGVAEPDEPLPQAGQAGREAGPYGETGIMPFNGLNITLEDHGMEPVAVPAGSWQDARNLSGSYRDGTPVVFWMVPGIPVPVQYRILNGHMDGDNPVQTYELVSWG